MYKRLIRINYFDNVDKDPGCNVSLCCLLSYKMIFLMDFLCIIVSVFSQRAD